MPITFNKPVTEIESGSHVTFFSCCKCHLNFAWVSRLTTGYGVNDKEEKICFSCCGKDDAEALRSAKAGEFIRRFYFSQGRLTNWPNTLSIKPYYSKTGRHNFGGTRTDFWFKFEGNNYWGYQIGNMSDIATVKKIKVN